MLKQTFLISGICFLSIVLRSQPNAPITPLHRYLQANFDSAIVLHSFSAWGSRPNYRIITKRNGLASGFTYRFPYWLFNAAAMPKQLADKFIKPLLAFDSTIPDTNAYFIPIMVWKNINEKQINKSLDSMHLWTIRDDKVDGNGCPEQKYGISDSVEYSMWLITKNEIKELYFYDPFFYENYCPGRKGRLTFIAFSKLINTIFQ